MKRTRDELVQTATAAEQSIVTCRNQIRDACCTIVKTAIELDNHDLKEHQNNTMSQFLVWTSEFLQNYNDTEDHQVLQQMLNNLNMSWTVKCNPVEGECDMKFYSNKLLLSLNDQLTVDAHIYVTSCQGLTIEKLELLTPNMWINMMTTPTKQPYENMARELGLTYDALLDLVGLCYFSFMFDPESPTETYSLREPNLPILTSEIVTTFGTKRCTNLVCFSSRYSPCAEKRLKALECPSFDFYPLYDSQPVELPSNWCGTCNDNGDNNDCDYSRFNEDNNDNDSDNNNDCNDSNNNNDCNDSNNNDSNDSNDV